MRSVDKQVAKQKDADKLKLVANMNAAKIKTPQNMINLIADYFKKNNIKYWLSEDQKTFRVGFDLENEGKYEVFINIHENYLIFNCEVLDEITDDAVTNTIDIITRINQFYNLGFLNFYFESRIVAFKNVYVLFENELTENKFQLYFDSTIDGARSCRPLVTKVAIDGEEPIIAMMNIGNNNS
jgi:hypothetical protein